MSKETSNTPSEKEKTPTSPATKEKVDQKVETPIQIAKRKFEEAKRKLFRIQGVRSERAQALKDVEAGTSTEAGKTEKKPEKKEDEGAKKEEEKALKETLDSLGGKHTTEIQEALSAKKLGDIDADARNIAHNELIYSLVPEQKKTEVREKMEKDKTFQQLSQIQKDEKIQQQVLSNLGKLPSDLQKTLLLDADKRGDTSGLSETLQKQFGVTAEQSNVLLPQLLDEKNVRDVLLKNIQENGMLVAGIEQNSPLGKELTGIIATNVGEYLSINPAQEGVVDIENFKGLKGVLGGGYEDLLYSKEFILGDQHALKKSRDMVKSGFEDEVAQIPEPDIEKDGAEKIKEYKKSVEKAFTNATGVEGDKAEKAIQKMSHQKISPLMRFLADLLAPIGALMGGKTGDFWRGYLNQRGADAQSENGTTNENYEQYGSGSEGIEGLQAGTILGAANKYMGVNESKDGALISQMHTSAGLKAGPSTPWCMSFVQHVLRKDMGYSSEQIGIGPSASAAAGHRIGRHTDAPQLGDIVLVRRNGGSGRHIAFFGGFDGDKVKLLGGNQGDSVSVKTYPKSSVAEYRTLQKSENPSQNESLAQSSSGLPVDLVKQFEGFSPKAYWDYKQWTVGYGTRGRQGETINESEAMTRLGSELQKHASSVDNSARKYGLNLTKNERDALISLDYNSGKANEVLGIYKNSGKQAAANRMLDIIRAGGEVLPGLVKRRKIETNLFLT